MINSIKSLNVIYQRYIPIEKIWGSASLLREYVKEDLRSNVGELIEFTPELDNQLVERYLYKGVFCHCPDHLLSPESSLIFKVIAAKENLSIQVHPNDDDAYRIEGKRLGKTEAWVVLNAQKGARVAVGFAQRMNSSKLQSLFQLDDWQNFLNWIEVKPGDLIYIPAGTVHAIGAGCVLAEIQQPTDITYRLFDYNRRDVDGRFRLLHKEKGRLAIDFDASGPNFLAEIKRLNHIYREYGEFHCNYFSIKRYCYDVASEIVIALSSFDLFFVSDGRVKLSFKDAPTLYYCKGETFMISANDVKEIVLEVRGCLLKFSTVNK